LEFPTKSMPSGFRGDPESFFAATAHIVMAALAAAIHGLLAALQRKKTWMAETSPAMTPRGGMG
jgi:hypothetical protein